MKALVAVSGASVAKAAANRRNAKKSTGPRTVAGKRASALNALRHGGLSVVPVLPGVERVVEWEAHRKATLASLAPVGYLETTLADRVAGLLWRLGRVTRYETENAASKLETAEADLADNLEHEATMAALSPRRPFRMGDGLGIGRRPEGVTVAQIRDELEEREDRVCAFDALSECGDAEVFPDAEAILYPVAERAGVDLENLPLEGLPETWETWTKKHILEAVAAVSAASEDKEDPRELLYYPRLLASADVHAAKVALREAESRLQRSVRSRTLLPADGLEKVARYETHLERSLFRALHELQRLQATRNGAGGIPVALDLDVSVGPRG